MTEDYIGFAFQISILTMASSIYMTVAGKFICQRLLKGQLVAKIICTPLPKIFVRHMKCSKQTNGNDCGVYAIANMASILHGVDPSSISFNVAAMRRHLLQDLENKKKSLFSPIENCLLKKYFVHVACQSTASCLHVQNVRNGSILAVNLLPKLIAKFDLQK